MNFILLPWLKASQPGGALGFYALLLLILAFAVTSKASGPTVNVNITGGVTGGSLSPLRGDFGMDARTGRSAGAGHAMPLEEPA